MAHKQPISDAKRRRQLEAARAKAVAARRERQLLRLQAQVRSLQTAQLLQAEPDDAKHALGCVVGACVRAQTTAIRYSVTRLRLRRASLWPSFSNKA